MAEVAGVPYNGSSIVSIAYSVKPGVNGTDGFSTLLVCVRRMCTTTTALATLHPRFSPGWGSSFSSASLQLPPERPPASHLSSWKRLQFPSKAHALASPSDLPLRLAARAKPRALHAGSQVTASVRIADLRASRKSLLSSTATV